MKEKLASSFGSAGSKHWELNLPRHEDGSPNFQWNHDLVKFPLAIQSAIPTDPKREYPGLDISKGRDATSVLLCQFDTGWSRHRKLVEADGYLSDKAVNFTTYNLIDSGDRLKRYRFPGPQNAGHGTATAHTIIGGPADEMKVEQLASISRKAPIYKENLNGGLFPYIKFLPIKVANRVVFNLNRPRFKVGHSVYQAVLHAKAQHADVITMSMGGKFGKKKRQTIREAVQLAYKNGIIFVCAAGNSLLADVMVDVIQPAAFKPATIAVAGIEPRFDRESEEIRYYPWRNGIDGKGVDISAPAKYIYTAHYSQHTEEGEQKEAYRFGGATSQATAHVAAAAALWRHFFSQELQDPWFQSKPSRIVDAFRWGLDQSKYVPEYWPTQRQFSLRNRKLFQARWNNKGILDVAALLDLLNSPLQYKAAPRYEDWDWG